MPLVTWGYIAMAGGAVDTAAGMAAVCVDGIVMMPCGGCTAEANDVDGGCGAGACPFEIAVLVPSIGVPGEE